MAATLTVESLARFVWAFQDALDLSTVGDNSNLEFSYDLANGTSAGQSNLIWHDTLAPISANSQTDLDLTVLTNTVFGSTVTISFAKVKGILIVNTMTTSGDELIIGGGTNPFLKPWNDVANSREFIGPGGAWFALNPVDGWTVTNSSNDNLRIANPSGNSESASPKVVIIGTSV